MKAILNFRWLWHAYCLCLHSTKKDRKFPYSGYETYEHFVRVIDEGPFRRTVDTIFEFSKQSFFQHLKRMKMIQKQIKLGARKSGRIFELDDQDEQRDQINLFPFFECHTVRGLRKIDMRGQYYLPRHYGKSTPLYSAKQSCTWNEAHIRSNDFANKEYQDFGVRPLCA